MHTWQRSAGQIHVDTGSLGAALDGRDFQACPAKAEPLAAPGWSEALPTQGCWYCSLQLGTAFPAKDPTLEAVWCIYCFLPTLPEEGLLEH